MINYILDYNSFINEGAISINSMEKAISNVLSYLNKKIGPLYQLPGFQTIKKKSGDLLMCLYYLDKNGDGIRFNWLAKGFVTDVHSVDFFDASKLFSKPKITLKLNGESFAKILPAIVEIHNKKSTSIDINSFLSESLNESRPKGSKNKSTLAKIQNGETEEDLTPSINAGEKKLAATKYADPDTIFEDIDAYVDMVIKRIQPSLIICGLPGVGKTHNVTKRIKSNGLVEIEPMNFPDDASLKDLKDMNIDPLEETNGDWVHIKGASTAYMMYVNLFKYKDKLIVFDDCDSVFKDKDGINVLKGALDSGAKRIISWASKSTMSKNAIAPPRFEFKGRIIFISNLSMEKIDSAVRSRSFVVDINLKREDVIKRIKTILPHIGSDLEVPLKMEAKERALSFLADAVNNGDEIEISIRTLVNFAKIAQSGIPQWKRLMEIQAQNM